MRRPRVLMLADQLGHPGGRVHGVTTYFVTHLSTLSQSVDLRICFLSPRHPAADALEASGVQPKFFGRRKWDVRSLWDARRAVRSIKPDVLHLHGEKSLIAGSLVGKSAGIPSIMHLHDATPLRPPLRPFQRALSAFVRRAIVVSDEIRGQADEYGFPGEKVRVLNYGVAIQSPEEVGPARARVRAELGLEDDVLLLGVIGRVNRDKGQLDAIRALADIVRVRPDVKLAVVGDGPGRYECESEAATLGVADRVVFTGQRRDVGAVLAALDLSLMPSTWVDAMPLVSLESIAAGRPVVAYDSGGIRNAVVQDVTGILVPRGDQHALTRETLALIQDPERRKRYGEAAREHAKRFSVSRHVEALVRIYDELLEDGSRSAQ